MLCLAQKNAASLMVAESVSKAKTDKALVLHPRSMASASSVAASPRNEVKRVTWKPTLLEVYSTLPPPASAERVERKSGRRETSAGASAAAPRHYHIPLPGCGHRELCYLSKRASGVLRHRSLAKRFHDGMIPLRVFCENFDSGRTPSNCLAVLVLGSNKVRFEVRAERLIDVSFLEHLKGIG
jgi:hypothetical protein